MFSTNHKVFFKKILFKVLISSNILSILIPNKLFYFLWKVMTLSKTFSTKPSKDLIKLFKLKDDLEKFINNRALAFGNGEHPKHYLISYHEFFIDNIIDGETVLDVGCGYGALSRSIANSKQKSIVIGLDYDESRLSQAVNSKNPKNLRFIMGDATQLTIEESFNVVVLSNVLEHIKDRIGFLRELQSLTKAKKYLIRVPCYERDWQVPLRSKLGVNYFNDDDHKIEHKLEEFIYEVKQSGLIPKGITTNWGEIWANCETL
jgi:ubiquinone/menaquinone biosynthesis C-methylase UbiE